MNLGFKDEENMGNLFKASISATSIFSNSHADDYNFCPTWHTYSMLCRWPFDFLLVYAQTETSKRSIQRTCYSK